MLIKNRKVYYVIVTVFITYWVIFKVFPLYGTAPESKTYADFEQSLCGNDIKYEKAWNLEKCPQQGIVTVMKGGRLGNQMWAYVTVWAYARIKGLKPYFPKCMRFQIAQMFDQLSVPDFEEIGHCPVNKKYVKYVNDRASWDFSDFSNESITILPQFIRKPFLILSRLKDIIQEFKFNRELTRHAQQILTGLVKNLPAKSYTFIGVHVRRTDYIQYIGRKYGDSGASRQFYINAMNYFKDKYPNCLFIFISDDPSWCHQEFGDQKKVYVTSYETEKVNSPAEDMAIMAACNHSIIDYGTFGEWGAILAGGETVYCNLKVNAFKGLAIWKNWTRMDN